MSYVLFATRKLALTSELMCAQLQQTQRTNEQTQMATQHGNLQQRVSEISSAKAGELANLYKQMVSADSSERDNLQLQVQEKQKDFDQQIEDVNSDIYEVSIKENIIQMEVKRLDTVVTVLNNQLKEIQTAEGAAIKESTPKFNGIQG